MYELTASGERRLLGLLALTQFTIIMDFMVMMPLGPQIMNAFSISPAAFATAVSAYSWCAGLSGLAAATYIDRFDRKRLLLATYLLFALSNLACACAGTYTLMLVSRAFAGITGGVLGSVIMAIVGDVIPPNRRGAAMGTIMSSFSLAAVFGVPAGVLLGAHFGWATPFLLLFALSTIFAALAGRIVPALSAHLENRVRSIRSVATDLWRLLTLPAHGTAFAMTFTLMIAQMLVIPFISPVLVANHGVAPASIAWLYAVGGIAPFFTSRAIGKLADRFGPLAVFRVMLVISTVPVLLITHLPPLRFIALVLLFPLFMVAMTGRMVPMQALLLTVPEPSARGAFLSVNSSFLSLGSGCGAWLGGLFLANSGDGRISGYGTDGVIATVLTLLVLAWAGRVKNAVIAQPTSATTKGPVPPSETTPAAPVGGNAAFDQAREVARTIR